MPYFVEHTVNVFSRRTFRFGWANDSRATGRAFIIMTHEDYGAQIETRNTLQTLDCDLRRYKKSVRQLTNDLPLANRRAVQKPVSGTSSRARP